MRKQYNSSIGTADWLIHRYIRKSGNYCTYNTRGYFEEDWDKGGIVGEKEKKKGAPPGFELFLGICPNINWHVRK